MLRFNGTVFLKTRRKNQPQLRVYVGEDSYNCSNEAVLLAMDSLLRRGSLHSGGKCPPG